VWSFEVSQGAPSQALVVTIHFVPTAIGRLGGSVGLDAGPGIGFGHWVYP
jgi:hypothetical protein